MGEPGRKLVTLLDKDYCRKVACRFLSETTVLLRGKRQKLPLCLRLDCDNFDVSGSGQRPPNTDLREQG